MNFEKLTEIKHKQILEKTIIHYPEVEDFCYCPYPDHPKGCPNTSKCDWLNIPSFQIIQECAQFKFFYLLYALFDFKTYKKKRQEENPDFFNTPRRIANLLYWQNSVKKIIVKKIEEIKQVNIHKEIYVLGCGYDLKLSFQDRCGSMEHSSINVFSTMKLNGIKFEVKPMNKVVLCCLLCSHEPIDFNITHKKKKTSILDFVGV